MSVPVKIAIMRSGLSSDFSIFHNHPVAIAVWLNLGFGRHPGQFRLGVSDRVKAVVHPIIVCAERNIAEGPLAQQGTIGTLCPVIEVTTRTS